MKISKLEPKYIEKNNPRIGLITLASDFRIEKDFNNIIYGRDIDLYSNRIKSAMQRHAPYKRRLNQSNDKQCQKSVNTYCNTNDTTSGFIINDNELQGFVVDD